MILPARRREEVGITGNEPQGDRQPAPAVLKAALDPTSPGYGSSTSGSSSAASRSRSSTTRAIARGKDTGRRPGAARRRPGEPGRRARAGCGRREDGRRGRRPVRRRGGPDLARQRRRRGPRDDEPRPARRPAAARPAAPGHATRPAPTDPRWPTSSTARATMPAGPRPVPRDDLAPPSGPLRVHVRGLLRRPARAGAAPRGPAARSRRHARSTAPGRGCSRVPTIGADNESPEEAAAVAELARSPRRGRRDLDRRGRARAPDRLGRRPDRRAVQRPGRRDPAAPAADGPRRDRRQVPGPGGADQHLLDDDVEPGSGAARHGLPLQPPPAERRDVAGALRRGRRRSRRISCGSGPGTRSRCASPTRSAGSPRSPDRAVAEARQRHGDPSAIAGSATCEPDGPLTLGL